MTAMVVVVVVACVHGVVGAENTRWRSGPFELSFTSMCNARFAGAKEKALIRIQKDSEKS